MKWHEQHGYTEDPFGRKDFGDKAVNLSEPAEELAYNVEAGNMVLVEGSKGTGKTTLLQTVIEKFRGERKVVYFDCSSNSVDVKKLMQEKYGLLGRVLNLTPRNMVLLLDNFSKMPKKDIERAKFYYDNNYIRSIVFAGEMAELPENVRDRIGPRVIKLKPISSDDAVELVKNRLGSLDLIPEKIIRKIYKKSGKDAAKFLENCGRACEAATNSGSEAVKDEHLKVLGGKK